LKKHPAYNTVLQRHQKALGAVEIAINAVMQPDENDNNVYNNEMSISDEIQATIDVPNDEAMRWRRIMDEAADLAAISKSDKAK
jgi:hypothetical protein